MTEIMDVSPMLCRNLLFIRINDYYAYTIYDLGLGFIFSGRRTEIETRRPSIIQLRPLGDILTFLTLIFIIFQILFLTIQDHRNHSQSDLRRDRINS